MPPEIFCHGHPLYLCYICGYPAALCSLWGTVYSAYEHSEHCRIVCTFQQSSRAQRCGSTHSTHFHKYEVFTTPSNCRYQKIAIKLTIQKMKTAFNGNLSEMGSH